MADGTTEEVTLQFDPKNARKHGQRNRDMIRKSLEEVGAFRSIGVDADGIVRAGNTVLAEALDLGFEVRIVDADPDEIIAVRRADLRGKKAERAALYDNRTAELAAWDTDILRDYALDEGDMLSDLFEPAELERMLDLPSLREAERVVESAVRPSLDRWSQAPSQDYGEDGDDDEAFFTGASSPRPSPAPDTRFVPKPPSDDQLEDVPDSLGGAFALSDWLEFPIDEELFGIPRLRKEMILEIPDAVETWPGDDLYEELETDGPYVLIYSNSCHRLDLKKTILSFYTDDKRFESLWELLPKFTAKFLNAKMLGVMTPDYSCYIQDPVAMHVWNIYRSRYCGRYMQEAGVKVIPTITFTTPEWYDLVLAGIPQGCATVALQAQTMKVTDESARNIRRNLTHLMKTVDPERVLIYGSKTGRELCAENNPGLNLVMTNTLMDRRRDHLRRDSTGLKR